ncbi:MAG: hypothetical protein RMK80_04250, partial [Pseudobdellovibrionaceae bacterium]|nr:hypothetical protein [Pseudobdellovibrionaceae bacterium]
MGQWLPFLLNRTHIFIARVIVRVTVFIAAVVAMWVPVSWDPVWAQMPVGPLQTILSLSQKKTYLGRPTSLLGQCFNGEIRTVVPVSGQGGSTDRLIVGGDFVGFGPCASGGAIVDTTHG